MKRAKRAGAATVVGFEANGGFLVGSDAILESRSLTALPTRNTMLPVLATLAATRVAGTSVVELVTARDAGEVASVFLKHLRSEAARFSNGSARRLSGTRSSVRSVRHNRSTSRTGSG